MRYFPMRATCWSALVTLLFSCPATTWSGTESTSNDRLSVVIMDPLARPLSCDCVKGYAQRDYEKLAEYLHGKMNRPVQLTFVQSLESDKLKKVDHRIDLIIGKDSVIRADSEQAKIKVTCLGMLTDKQGETTQTGLFVVAQDNPARSLRDLAGYRIFFGPASCDEKHAAALATLRQQGVAIPDKLDVVNACSEGAIKVVALGPKSKVAAVISSYAAPLLEGCGTVKRGDLRVIAKTAPVPFITAYATDSLTKEEQSRISDALFSLAEDDQVCNAIESLIGFIPLKKKTTANEKRKQPTSKPTAAEDSASVDVWPQWRGANRDSVVPRLPNTLPEKPNVVWRYSLAGPGLGGIVATKDYVVFGDRNLTDTHDVFRCIGANDGASLWTIEYEATGELDYGNTPRATPLIHNEMAFCLGAFGNLTCADLATGLVFWKKDLRDQFGVNYKWVWGATSSPLIVDNRLIVNPGGPEASLVALDPMTGSVVWKTGGRKHAYASFVAATLGGKRQVVGYDRLTLGGWDVESGRRLWELKPENAHDFNVPTPVVMSGKLFVATENNGARLYSFSVDGRIRPTPDAVYEDLTPDMSSAVVVGDRLFCVFGALFCLAYQNGESQLRELWVGEDDDFPVFAPIIAGKDRLLVVGQGGRLLLVDARSDSFRIISRLDPFAGSNNQLYSHPALVGTRLYLRGETELICLELGS